MPVGEGQLGGAGESAADAAHDPAAGVGRHVVPRGAELRRLYLFIGHGGAESSFIFSAPWPFGPPAGYGPTSPGGGRSNESERSRVDAIRTAGYRLSYSLPRTATFERPP